MIDWITAKIPCVHVPIPAGKTMRIDAAGEIEYTVPHRTQVKGSHDASISIKSQGNYCEGKLDVLHVSGNFAKFLQGHNIIGSRNINAQIWQGLKLLCTNLSLSGIHLADSIDWDSVHSGNIEIDRIDINSMYSLPSNSDVNSWLRAAEYSSRTRHGRPVNSKGTVYWGKNSRRWSIKAYNKAEEIKASGDHKLQQYEIFEPLREFAQGKLRLELTLRQLELRTLGIHTASQLNETTVNKLFTSYMGKLTMTQKVLLNDVESLDVPRAALSTYHMWKMGMVPFDMLPKATFYRQRKQLLEFGIDISNPSPQSNSNVVPLIRVLEAEPVSNPDWAYNLRLIAAA